MADQPVESAGAIQRHQLVTAADMLSVDEDLRHGGPAIGALDHFLTLPAITPDIDFIVVLFLAFEQGFRPDAVGAPGLGVNLYIRH